MIATPLEPTFNPHMFRVKPSNDVLSNLFLYAMLLLDSMPGAHRPAGRCTPQILFELITSSRATHRASVRPTTTQHICPSICSEYVKFPCMFAALSCTLYRIKYNR